MAEKPPRAHEGFSAGGLRSQLRGDPWSAKVRGGSYSAATILPSTRPWVMAMPIEAPAEGVA